MELIKPLGNINLVPCLQGSWQPYQVSKEGHFLAGLGELQNGAEGKNLSQGKE